MEMAHRIRRLQWRMKADRENGFHLRQLVREQWQEQLLESLQGVLDEFASDDELIHLPRLVLQINIPPSMGMTEDIAPVLRQQIREQLMVFKKESRAPSIGLEEVALSSPLDQTQLDFLLAYLRDGILPWPLVESDSTTTAQRCREICRQHRDALLGYAVAQTPVEGFYYRLFQLIDQETLPAWFEQWVATLPVAQRRPASELVAALLDMDTNDLLHATLVLLARLVTFDASGWNKGTLIELANGMSPETRKRWTVIVRRARVPDIGLAQPHDALAGIHAASVETSSTGYVPQLSRLPQTSTGSPPPETRLNGNVNTMTESSLVHTAGLVLLHPYLVRFFAYLGVTGPEKTRIPENHLARAAALLHYLATGREEIHEFELGLIKVLLGLTPANTLLVGRGLLSDSDKEEADNLLRAVIGHWKALKATSVAGLRQTFLQRSGLLREDERSFVLHVERTGFDVLLEHLPWSYSITRLPWMTKPLSTEW